MHHRETVGAVDQHVQRLPDRRRKKLQPVIVAGRGEQQENEKRAEAERLERKADEAAIVRPDRQLGDDIGQRVLHRIPFDHEGRMQRRDDECQDAEMPPVVEQRQEARAQPRQRPDREDRGQHQERAQAEGADAKIDPGRTVFGRMQVRLNGDERDDEGRNDGEQDGVVDQLVAVPLNGAEADAHERASAGAGGKDADTKGAAGAGRSASAIARPSATAMPSTVQTRRCMRRCVRVMTSAVAVPANGETSAARSRATEGKRRAAAGCARQARPVRVAATGAMRRRSRKQAPRTIPQIHREPARQASDLSGTARIGQGSRQGKMAAARRGRPAGRACKKPRPEPGL